MEWWWCLSSIKAACTNNATETGHSRKIHSWALKGVGLSGKKVTQLGHYVKTLKLDHAEIIVGSMKRYFCRTVDSYITLLYFFNILSVLRLLG